MEREAISREELIAKLNEELSRHPDYYQCSYESVEKLEQPDERGCNWSNAVIKCSGMHTGVCQPAGFKIAEEMKKKYNVL